MFQFYSYKWFVYKDRQTQDMGHKTSLLTYEKHVETWRKVHNFRHTNGLKCYLASSLWGSLKLIHINNKYTHIQS